MLIKLTYITYVCLSHTFVIYKSTFGINNIRLGLTDVVWIHKRLNLTYYLTTFDNKYGWETVKIFYGENC